MPHYTRTASPNSRSYLILMISVPPLVCSEEFLAIVVVIRACETLITTRLLRNWGGEPIVGSNWRLKVRVNLGPLAPATAPPSPIALCDDQLAKFASLPYQVSSWVENVQGSECQKHWRAFQYEVEVLGSGYCSLHTGGKLHQAIDDSYLVDILAKEHWYLTFG